ncbi:hypothetical protein B7Y94_04440 [Candidatus Saccharibacteria bacterium 32-49-12]|nr:MAG: hypothetical protein B7Y94_04440 [Candidatus Saccharibacteria bacterium 32-49-12]
MSVPPSQPPNHDTSTTRSRSGAVIMIATATDTTMRMFVPTVGGMLLGLWLDSRYETSPWLLIGGIVIGVSLAYLLVARQFKSLRKK